MNLKYACITFALVLSLALAEKISFKGYKLYKIYAETQQQADLIAELEHSPDFDLWSRVRQEGVLVALGPSVLEKYEALFKLFKIKFEIVNHNIQDSFDEEERQMMKKRDTDSSRIAGRYVRHGDHSNWKKEQAEKFPELVSTYVAGYSHENRELRVITIGTKQAKRKIWIDCGIHAREWVSPSTCIWVAEKLISDFNKGDASTIDLLNYYEFHILSVMNPDGYEYSHTTSRLWRKNRNPNPGASCIGVDLNRNFGFQWMTGGSSNIACADTYAGPRADSEPETQAVQKAINEHIDDWDLFLTIHSYGKWLFTPYGYTGTILPPDFDDQDASAKKSVQALQNVYGETGWITGSSAKILYIASGGSEDWAYGTAKIKYSYCFELRPGNNDADYHYGFTLPEDRAPLAGQETYEGIRALVSDIRSKTQ